MVVVHSGCGRLAFGSLEAHSWGALRLAKLDELGRLGFLQQSLGFLTKVFDRLVADRRCEEPGEHLSCDSLDFLNAFAFAIAIDLRLHRRGGKSTCRLNRLYIKLLRENPGWDTAARRLRAALDEAGDGQTPGSARKLLHLRQRIARIRIFDPACGSGNFLIIAYKQIREIQAALNRRRGEAERRSDLPLTNFRGIELRHFSCEIARLALIIAEYQCDVLYRGQKLALAEFLPLEAANWIT
jgi:N-6 DNA Methylase